jgi:hypothetical protein
MAITTYSELVSAVNDWTHRADIATRVPDFITQAEDDINRRLRVREMEAEADIAIVGGTRTAALPSDFGELRRFYLNSNPITFLNHMSPNDYWRRYTSTNTGKPSVFTIEGSNLVFGPIPDGDYTGKLQYYRKLPAIATSAHGVFTANPFLYLYGALAEAERFMKNDKRTAVWEDKVTKIIMDLYAQTSRVAGSMVIRDDYNPH